MEIGSLPVGGTIIIQISIMVCTRSPKPRHLRVVVKSSILLICAKKDLSYSGCVRWTENPKDRVRVPEGPLNMVFVV